MNRTQEGSVLSRGFLLVLFFLGKFPRYALIANKNNHGVTKKGRKSECDNVSSKGTFISGAALGPLIGIDKL